MGMEDKIEDLLARYSLKIKHRKKSRGALLLDTDRGRYIFKQYQGNAARIDFEEDIKSMLAAKGYTLTDTALKNIDGQWLTKDCYGNDWIMRAWHPGQECDIENTRQIYAAAEHMAKLHLMMDGRDIEKNELMSNAGCVDIYSMFDRHNRELKHIYTYIRKKRKKNDMELCMLNTCEQFRSQGEYALEFLKESGIEKLCSRCREEKWLIHGNYNYHNISFGADGIITTNFTGARVGLQIMDLYDFLRKILEKNNWDTRTGIGVIEAYSRGRTLSAEEKKVFFALLLYPEKYWKQLDFYYNSKKAWVSAKNHEKLKRICSQETERKQFLSDVKRLLF